MLEAEDGREVYGAAKDLRRGDISLVLLDMTRAGDGRSCEVLEEMNNQGFIEDIPVIIITADGLEEKRCGRPTAWAWRTAFRTASLISVSCGSG